MRWLLLVLLAFAARAAEPQPFEAVEPHMGTLFRIKLYASGEQQANRAFRAAFDRIAGLDRALSDYQPESELNRLCRTSGRAVAVSADLFQVLQAAQQIAAETAGAFDVTLGPVTRLWRAARARNRVPDEDALRAAALRCGYRKLHLDAKRRSVLLEQAGMQLDLGGIAKGYAADAALDTLERLGIHSALVAASGDLAFSDPPPGRRGWKIGIDSLDRPDADFTSVLELAHAAVSTSGDAEQHTDAAGRRYSHIVDPATDMGLTHPVTVTIIARRGMAADALATAASVMGPDRALPYLEAQPGVAALFVTRRGDRAEILASTRFQALARQ
jgi:thiamine biosynthesis lipoprotein